MQGGVDLDAELSEYVAERPRAASRSWRTEAVQNVESEQLEEPVLGHVRPRVKGAGDLRSREDLVLDEPVDERQIALGEVGLDGEYRIADRAGAGGRWGCNARKHTDSW